MKCLRKVRHGTTCIYAKNVVKILTKNKCNRNTPPKKGVGSNWIVQETVPERNENVPEI